MARRSRRSINPRESFKLPRRSDTLLNETVDPAQQKILADLSVAARPSRSSFPRSGPLLRDDSNASPGELSKMVRADPLWFHKLDKTMRPSFSPPIPRKSLRSNGGIQLEQNGQSEEPSLSVEDSSLFSVDSSRRRFFKKKKLFSHSNEFENVLVSDNLSADQNTESTENVSCSVEQTAIRPRSTRSSTRLALSSISLANSEITESPRQIFGLWKGSQKNKYSNRFSRAFDEQRLSATNTKIVEADENAIGSSQRTADDAPEPTTSKVLPMPEQSSPKISLSPGKKQSKAWMKRRSARQLDIEVSESPGRKSLVPGIVKSTPKAPVPNEATSPDVSPSPKQNRSRTWKKRRSSRPPEVEQLDSDNGAENDADPTTLSVHDGKSGIELSNASLGLSHNKTQSKPFAMPRNKIRASSAFAGALLAENDTSDSDEAMLDSHVGQNKSHSLNTTSSSRRMSKREKSSSARQIVNEASEAPNRKSPAAEVRKSTPNASVPNEETSPGVSPSPKQNRSRSWTKRRSSRPPEVEELDSANEAGNEADPTTLSAHDSKSGIEMSNASLGLSHNKTRSKPFAMPRNKIRASSAFAGALLDGNDTSDSDEDVLDSRVGQNKSHSLNTTSSSRRMSKRKKSSSAHQMDNEASKSPNRKSPAAEVRKSTPNASVPNEETSPGVSPSPKQNRSRSWKKRRSSLPLEAEDLDSANEAVSEGDPTTLSVHDGKSGIELSNASLGLSHNKTQSKPFAMPRNKIRASSAFAGALLDGNDTSDSDDDVLDSRVGQNKSHSLNKTSLSRRMSKREKSSSARQMDNEASKSPSRKSPAAEVRRSTPNASVPNEESSPGVSPSPKQNRSRSWKNRRSSLPLEAKDLDSANEAGSDEDMLDSHVRQNKSHSLNTTSLSRRMSKREKSSPGVSPSPKQNRSRSWKKRRSSLPLEAEDLDSAYEAGSDEDMLDSHVRQNKSHSLNTTSLSRRMSKREKSSSVHQIDNEASESPNRKSPAAEVRKSTPNASVPNEETSPGVSSSPKQTRSRSWKKNRSLRLLEIEELDSANEMIPQDDKHSRVSAPDEHLSQPDQPRLERSRSTRQMETEDVDPATLSLQDSKSAIELSNSPGLSHRPTRTKVFAMPRNKIRASSAFADALLSEKDTSDSDKALSDSFAEGNKSLNCTSSQREFEREKNRSSQPMATEESGSPSKMSPAANVRKPTPKASVPNEESSPGVSSSPKQNRSRSWKKSRSLRLLEIEELDSANEMIPHGANHSRVSAPDEHLSHREEPRSERSRSALQANKTRASSALADALLADDTYSDKALADYFAEGNKSLNSASSSQRKSNREKNRSLQPMATEESESSSKKAPAVRKSTPKASVLDEESSPGVSSSPKETRSTSWNKKRSFRRLQIEELDSTNEELPHGANHSRVSAPDERLSHREQPRAERSRSALQANKTRASSALADALLSQDNDTDEAKLDSHGGRNESNPSNTLSPSRRMSKRFSGTASMARTSSKSPPGAVSPPPRSATNITAIREKIRPTPRKSVEREGKIDDASSLPPSTGSGVSRSTVTRSPQSPLLGRILTSTPTPAKTKLEMTSVVSSIRKQPEASQRSVASFPSPPIFRSLPSSGSSPPDIYPLLPPGLPAKDAVSTVPTLASSVTGDQSSRKQSLSTGSEKQSPTSPEQRRSVRFEVPGDEAVSLPKEEASPKTATKRKSPLSDRSRPKMVRMSAERSPARSSTPDASSKSTLNQAWPSVREKAVDKSEEDGGDSDASSPRGKTSKANFMQQMELSSLATRAPSFTKMTSQKIHPSYVRENGLSLDTISLDTLMDLSGMSSPAANAGDQFGNESKKSRFEQVSDLQTGEPGLAHLSTPEVPTLSNETNETPTSAGGLREVRKPRTMDIRQFLLKKPSLSQVGDSQNLGKSIYETTNPLPPSSSKQDDQPKFDPRAILDRMVQKYAYCKKEPEVSTGEVKKLQQKTKQTPTRASGKPQAHNKKFQLIMPDGEVYKPPKLVKPKKFVTDKMYRFLVKKLEPKYDLSSRVKSEEFVTYLCDTFTKVVRRKNTKGLIERLLKRMVRLGLVATYSEFYRFVENFMPRNFRRKAIPCIGSDLAPEQTCGLYEKIILP